jgi:SAM-dependent methyltransferase
MIDQLARETSRPHILSVASGHLREAALCAAVKRGSLGRFVALDADPGSLAEVDRCYGRQGVETLTASFRKLLGNRLEVGHFDLVYSTGLFDYLDQSIARRLVSSMFRLLNPAGRLVVANFLPGIRDVGYMEAYMDWHLVYRTRREMIDITMDIPQDSIGHITISAEENQNIIFLQVANQATCP